MWVGVSVWVGVVMLVGRDFKLMQEGAIRKRLKSMVWCVCGGGVGRWGKGEGGGRVLDCS